MNINPLSITKAFLAIALVVLLFPSCKQNATSNTGVDSTNAMYVFVNSDSLLANYDFFLEMKDNLEETAKNLEIQATSRARTFQQEVERYQAQAPTMTPAQRQSTEQTLSRRQLEVQQYQQGLAQQISIQEQAANDSLYTKVAKYLEDYSKQKGYKMVLTFSRNNSGILYADPSLDVTKDVLKGLNEAYKKEKKK